MLPVRVLVISDVGNPVKRMSLINSLLLDVCHLYAVLGEREGSLVLLTRYPRKYALFLRGGGGGIDCFKA